MRRKDVPNIKGRIKKDVMKMWCERRSRTGDFVRWNYEQKEEQEGKRVEGKTAYVKMFFNMKTKRKKISF